MLITAGCLSWRLEQLVFRKEGIIFLKKEQRFKNTVAAF